MKEKIITLKIDGALQGQWSSLLLELNLMKQAWKSYGVDIDMKAPRLCQVTIPLRFWRGRFSVAVASKETNRKNVNKKNKRRVDIII